MEDFHNGGKLLLFLKTWKIRKYVNHIPYYPFVSNARDISISGTVDSAPDIGLLKGNEVVLILTLFSVLQDIHASNSEESLQFCHNFDKSLQTGARTEHKIS